MPGPLTGLTDSVNGLDWQSEQMPPNTAADDEAYETNIHVELACQSRPGGFTSGVRTPDFPNSPFSQLGFSAPLPARQSLRPRDLVVAPLAHHVAGVVPRVTERKMPPSRQQYAGDFIPAKAIITHARRGIADMQYVPLTGGNRRSKLPSNARGHRQVTIFPAGVDFAIAIAAQRARPQPAAAKRWSDQRAVLVDLGPEAIGQRHAQTSALAGHIAKALRPLVSKQREVRPAAVFTRLGCRATLLAHLDGPFIGVTCPRPFAAARGCFTASIVPIHRAGGGHAST